MKFTYPSGTRPLDGYTIKRGIGIGGFGEVYFATSDAGKEVALKHIQRNLDIELRGVTQCLNLKHVNLIALYDIKYDDDGEAWVVMEYVGGESLKDAIERSPKGMPIDDVVSWFDGMAAGVAYLHDHGIVHRDLKPGNIFTDGDIVKIGDYGLSKFISCSRRSGQTESVGTFHYMAPEIGKGVYGKEIDVYALGIILHEMLTGRVPFDGETSQEIIMKHLTAVPQLEGIPNRFANVIRRALSKDPAHRYSSVAEMHERVVGTVPPQVAASQPAPASRPAARPNPIVAEVKSEPIYIMDEPADSEGMIFGPLRERAADEAPVVFTAAASPGGRAGLRRGWCCGGAAFANTRFGASLKVLLLVGAGLVIAMNAWLLLPLAALGLAFYLIYSGLRLAAPAASSTMQRHVVLATARRSAEARARELCRHKSPQRRAGELLGSMLQAAMGCAVLSLFGLILVAPGGLDAVSFGSNYAWLVITATLSSWLLLLLGKYWEPREMDASSRRGLMLLGGLLVGLIAFALGNFLDVHPLHDARSSAQVETLNFGGWYAGDRAPLLPAYLAYFAGVFIVPRWWIAVDPLRRTRVRLTSAAITGVWAWVLHLIIYFPQPAGVLVAVTVSLGTQLAASWWDLNKQTESQALAA